MATRKHDGEKLRAVCAEILPDDGVDPREDKKRGLDRTKRDDRKTQQLCKQVAHTLQLVLPDLTLPSDVRIAKVEPAPDTARLRVTVAIADPARQQQVAARLEQCTGHLRSELAQAIARRRVPRLVFTVISDEVPRE